MNTFGELKEFPALSMALESKVIAERESLFTRLKEATTELVSSSDVNHSIHTPLFSPLPVKGC